MKKLKMTKREAAITFLELCHGYLVLFAIYACAVVTSGHGNEPFIQVGLLLFPGECDFVCGCKMGRTFLAVWFDRCAGSCGFCYGGRKRGARNLDGDLGVLAAISYFYARAARNTCWLEAPVYPWIGIDDFVFSWRSFCIRYGSTDRTDTGGCIFSDLQFPYESGRSGYLFEKSCNNGASAGATAGQNQSGYDVDRIGTDGGCDDRRALSWLRSADTAAGKCFEDGDSLAVASDSQLPCGRGRPWRPNRRNRRCRLSAIRHLGFWNCSISCWISLAG